LNEKTPVRALTGVGPKLEAELAELGIRCIRDLWFHLPLRYEDRTRLTEIAALAPNVQAQFEGLVEFVEVRMAPRRSLLVTLSDGSGLIRLRFFHFQMRQQTELKRGMRLRCFGEVRHGLGGLESIHPQYRVVNDELPLSENLTPVYPSSEALGRERMKRLVTQALALLEQAADLELLPEAELMPLKAALLCVHKAAPGTDLQALKEQRHPAQLRLAFEELVAHQLAMRINRGRLKSLLAKALPGTRQLIRNLLKALPFKLTDAQNRVLKEIAFDLQQHQPMLRLVQGDVGSGKTLVAAISALLAIESGSQAALLAPTELLAEQHFSNFKIWFEPLGLEVIMLAGKVTGKARVHALNAIARGAQMVVGTHALIQEGVQFADLALVIIDEQHRFGVKQRLALRNKGLSGTMAPHQLIMTATPIPRTLAMVAYADLDVSVIDALPPGRSPIQTVLIDSARRSQVIERIAKACSEGRQAYWVCTLIDPSEQLEAKAAEQTYQQLREALPEIAIGLVHGRLKAQEKADIMKRFKSGELKLLVATTVIEVGVDVPNASLMIIENAERLGLAQLHQLRGRVGRGSAQSACVLMLQKPIGTLAKERVETMRLTQDGFAIAEADLRLRGPGEFLGAKQAGVANFRIANLARDRDQLPQVRALADQIVLQDPERIGKLIERWIGEAERLADA
jgi:ATP-dependent DNA helicase RecG